MTLLKSYKENVNDKEITIKVHIPDQPKNTQKKINAIYDILSKEVEHVA